MTTQTIENTQTQQTSQAPQLKSVADSIQHAQALTALPAKLESLNVQVGQPYFDNQNSSPKYTVSVTDTIEGSFTKGWTVEYTPTISSNGSLYDSAKAINRAIILDYANAIHPVLVDINNRFISGDRGLQISDNASQFVYENLMATVFVNQTDLSVDLQVNDLNSPFYLLNVRFNIRSSQMRQGDIDVADLTLGQNGELITQEAVMAPKKHRVSRVDNRGNAVGRKLFIADVKYLHRHFASIMDTMIRDHALAIATPIAQQMQVPQQPMNNNSGYGNYRPRNNYRNNNYNNYNGNGYNNNYRDNGYQNNYSNNYQQQQNQYVGGQVGNQQYNQQSQYNQQPQYNQPSQYGQSQYNQQQSQPPYNAPQGYSNPSQFLQPSQTMVEPTGKSQNASDDAILDELSNSDKDFINNI